MPGFSPRSQYLCTNCRAVLKQTDAEIEIEAIVEDCPNCGADLANNLKRRTETAVISSLPKLQTAYDLTRFKIDIEKLSRVMPLSTTGSLCIVGYNANLLLTRLCIRTLLPANHGGLDSPNVIVVDAGNRSDFYLAVNFARQYGLDLQDALDRIIVSRTFTIHQLKNVLRELPKVVQKYQARAVIVPGLLDLFEDPNIKKREARRVIDRIMKAIDELSNKLLVITSLQTGNYANSILPAFEKRIMLSIADRRKLYVEVYDAARSNEVTITEKELKIVKQ